MTGLINYEAPQVELQERETLITPVVWWVVLVIVLLAIGATIAIGVVAWCIIHGGGFVVQYQVINGGSQVRIGCSK